MQPIFYDTIIIGGIIIGITLSLLFCFLKKSFFSIIFLIGAIVLVWGSFIEPRIITTKHVTVKLGKQTPQLKIAVLGDLHAGPYKKTAFFERVVEKTIQLNPDIVVLVGDYTYNGLPENKREVEYLSPLKKLTEKYKVYAVPGNHEYGLSDYLPEHSSQTRFADVSEVTREAFESYGITYLQNQTLSLEINGQQIYLFGGDEVWSGNLDYSSIEDTDPTIPKIALLHNPAYLYHEHPTGIDLTIAGHTHGGQIRLPFIGPLGKADDTIPKKLYTGLHEPERKGEYLFVTQGLGESEARARLLCPPEIVLLEIGT